MLRNPDTALTLYTILVILGFMLGKRWQGVRDTLTGAGKTAQAKSG